MLANSLVLSYKLFVPRCKVESISNYPMTFFTGEEAYTITVFTSLFLNKVRWNSYCFVPSNIFSVNSGFINNNSNIGFRFRILVYTYSLNISFSMLYPINTPPFCFFILFFYFWNQPIKSKTL